MFSWLLVVTVVKDYLSAECWINTVKSWFYRAKGMSAMLIITKPVLQNVASVTDWSAEQRIRSVRVVSGVMTGPLQGLLDRLFRHELQAGVMYERDCAI